MSEEQQVVAQAAALAQRVARDHGGPEERPDVDDLGRPLLVLERDDAIGRPPRLEQVDGAVAHLPQAPPAALLLVGCDRGRSR